MVFLKVEALLFDFFLVYKGSILLVFLVLTHEIGQLFPEDSGVHVFVC